MSNSAMPQLKQTGLRNQERVRAQLCIIKRHLSFLNGSHIDERWYQEKSIQHLMCVASEQNFLSLHILYKIMKRVKFKKYIIILSKLRDREQIFLNLKYM
ncbi:hypothetical protein V6Z12_A05G335600 [Gossypium hirsutum]